MDKDRSGKVDAAEFGKALQRLHVVGASAKAVKAVIKTADPNGDGKLEYKELLPKLQEVRAMPAKPVFQYDDHGHHISASQSRSASPVRGDRAHPKGSSQGSPARSQAPVAAPSSASTHFGDTMPRAKSKEVGATEPHTPPRTQQPRESHGGGGGAEQGGGGQAEAAAEYNALLAMPLSDAVAVVWHSLEEYAKRTGPLRTLELFREFDKDRNGKVSCAEFGKALGRMGLHCPPSILKAAIKAADSNGDGKLEYKDVLAKLKEVSQRK
jgi:Ca2+-binding EF-hand superfamily protein